MSAKRHLMGLLAGFGLWMVSGTAEAQVHLVWPEFGVGGGVVASGIGGPAIQLDFGIGAEGQGYPWSRGFLARFDLLLIDDDLSGNFNRARIDIAPLFTLSSTYDTAAPFFRVGAGPLLAFSDTAVSFGAHGEAAVGFKSIVDLYVDGKVSADIGGPELALTAGLRLNAYLFDWFYGGYYRVGYRRYYY